MATNRWIGAAILATAALASGCTGSKGDKGDPGSPGITTAEAPLQLDGAGRLSIATASASSPGALSAADWAGFDAKVSGSDPRLSDARAPLPGSAAYIQNGTAPQAGDLHVTGTVTAGTLSAAAFSFAAPVTRVVAIPPAAFLPVKAGVTYDGQIAGGSRWVTGGTYPAWLAAPLHLPNGAWVQQLRCNVINNSATTTVGVGILTSAADGSPVTGGATVETVLANASPTFQTLTDDTYWPTSTTDTVYWVGFIPYIDSACASDCQILGCWVTYTETEIP